MSSKPRIAEIQEKARTMRHHIVDMIGCEDGKVGHLGGSCSAVDLVAALYFYKMEGLEDLENPARDRFLLSKGHAALVQYAALAERGIIPQEELKNVKNLDAMLQGHPDMTRTPGIEASTGSLGQGLSIGLGLALGLRMDGMKNAVYVLMGDGEQAEGQIWEAAMAASHYRTDRLIGILDHNLVQATGTVRDRLSTGDLGAKWRAFGWYVIEVDGHDVPGICQALDEADGIEGCPVLILAHTVKGKGIRFAEGEAAFHNCGLTSEQLRQAHSDIDEDSLARGSNG